MEVGNSDGSHSEMVGNGSGSPPAASTPRLTASISSGVVRWQLLKPEPVSTIPTTGRSNIACEYPIDLANERRRYSAKSRSP